MALIVHSSLNNFFAIVCPTSKMITQCTDCKEYRVRKKKIVKLPSISPVNTGRKEWY